MMAQGTEVHMPAHASPAPNVVEGNDNHVDITPMRPRASVMFEIQHRTLNEVHRVVRGHISMQDFVLPPCPVAQPSIIFL